MIELAQATSRLSCVGNGDTRRGTHVPDAGHRVPCVGSGVVGTDGRLGSN